MRPLSRLTNGIRALFRSGIADQELDAELNAFLETAVDEKMRSGMGREEATRAARLETGLVSTHSVKERVRCRLGSLDRYPRAGLAFRRPTDRTGPWP